ncbi:MAG TPA: tRNA (adenosine(37)-N6)-threonylcarbamoyltransferase complex ATPase subunit type 1 TsaE [Bdellovibrionota bacterium]|nr:tRNA (adenosine(37)-N6)-threonylcarbamoyltransferase complex ATPase subunit type 1 TsaE [Bdellovibrionota bacterium]
MATFQTKTPEETQKFAGQLAQLLKPGDLIGLVGELGAGKTCFTKGIVQALHGDVHVTSPSFTLVNIYDAKQPHIHHIDLYRLEGARDLQEIGFEECISGEAITLIEWFDNIPEIASQEHLQIMIQAMTNGTREISITGTGPRAQEILDALQNHRPVIDDILL